MIELEGASSVADVVRAQARKLSPRPCRRDQLVFFSPSGTPALRKPSSIR